MSAPKQKQNDDVNADSPQIQATRVITEQDIAQRAYSLYIARGAAEGHALDDWLQAEKELQENSLAA